MSDLYHRSGAVCQDEFRQATERAKVMSGAAFTPRKAKCCKCGVHRTEQTGTWNGERFTCHGCGRK